MFLFVFIIRELNCSSVNVFLYCCYTSGCLGFLCRFLSMTSYRKIKIALHCQGNDELKSLTGLFSGLCLMKSYNSEQYQSLLPPFICVGPSRSTGQEKRCVDECVCAHVSESGREHASTLGDAGNSTFGMHLLHLLERASQATCCISIPHSSGTWLLAAKGLR